MKVSLSGRKYSVFLEFAIFFNFNTIDRDFYKKRDLPLNHFYFERSYYYYN